MRRRRASAGGLLYPAGNTPRNDAPPVSTCGRYSRAYLHHLTKAGEALGRQLLAKHTKPETTLAMTSSAAPHVAARGRVPLGTEWLARWRRSQAGVPSDVPVEGYAGFADRITGLAPFRTACAPA